MGGRFTPESVAELARNTQGGVINECQARIREVELELTEAKTQVRRVPEFEKALSDSRT
jgi:hypothetical protein